jgi:hypothetical protein
MKVHGSDLVLYPHKRAWVNKRLRHGPGFSTAKSSPSLPLTPGALDCYKSVCGMLLSGCASSISNPFRLEAIQGQAPSFIEREKSGWVE